jgi:D-glycero-D-manno-heptose 1,7-bisphosphate phosphatase
MRPADPRPALFLDRDGVINVDVGYLHRPGDLALIDGSAEAIARVNRLGVPVVVITNQAGIGRGYYDEAAFRAVQAKLEQVLAERGAHLDGCYFCPHHPVHGVGRLRVACDCRKPKPGLLLQASRELGLDLAASLLIGDKDSDLEAGRAAGCTTLLVRTGYGATHEAELVAAGRTHAWDAVFDTLRDAAGFIEDHFSRSRSSTGSPRSSR